MKCEIDFPLLNQMEQDVCEQYPVMVSHEFQACAQHILTRLNLRTPQSIEEAIEVYFGITAFIEAN